MNSFTQLSQLMSRSQPQKSVQQDFDPDKFKAIIPQVPDTLINQTILQARMQGISEEQIRQGLALINKYR